MFTSYIIQLLGDKLKSIFSFLNSFYDVIKYVSLIYSTNDKKSLKGDNNDDDLFSKPTVYQTFNSTSKTLHSCAVSEFDYDFASPNPFSWEFQNLVLANQINSNNVGNNDNNNLITPDTKKFSTITNEKTIGDTSLVINNNSNTVINNSANIINSENQVVNNNLFGALDLSIPTNLLFNSNIVNNTATAINLDATHIDLNNANAQNQEANEILSQFSTNFQNQLKNNELYRIYQNQTHDQYDQSQFQLQTQAGIQLKKTIRTEATEYFDDYDDDYLQQGHSHQKQIESQTQLKSSHSRKHSHQHHFETDDDDDDYEDDFDEDDALPLDQELMLSFLRHSNDNLLPAYYINSDLSEGNTVSPHTSDSAASDASPINQRHNSGGSLVTTSSNHNKREIEETETKANVLREDANSNIAKSEPQKKYRKLTISSKPSNSRSETLCSDSLSPSSSTASSSRETTKVENNTLSEEEESLNVITDDDIKKEDKSQKLYICPICQTTFRVKGYLTRHRKKHFASKPFQCPYFDPTIDYDDDEKHEHSENSDDEHDHHSEDKSKIPRCHPTGGFSRRDTFKTHLKALHFVYPTGTKSGDRSDKKGRCAACFKEFKTNKEWLETHVMTNQCEGMITKYK